MTLLDLVEPASGQPVIDCAALLNRSALGLFFVFSGFHKLFNRERRASLAETFKADGCYSPAMMWVIPCGEFFGGLALLAGFLTQIAALGLVAICGGASFLDGVKRIRAWKPLDAADAVDDALYLPEVLYVVMLVGLIIVGPGRYSADHYLLSLIR